MWNCPKCQAEVEDNFEVCWQCGTAADGQETPGFVPEVEGIITAEEFQEEQAEKTREALVTVARVGYLPKAHAIRSLLEAEGIPAFVGDELMSSTAWELTSPSGIQVRVFEKDAERAGRILAAANPEEHAPPEEDEA